MNRVLRTLVLGLGLVCGLGSAMAWAQSEASNQFWANLTLGFSKGEKLYFELDAEPKIQSGGADVFRNIDFTPAVEFYPTDWIDLTGEAIVGFTQEYGDVESFEYTGRIGIRIQILSSDRKMLFPKRKGLGRIVLANWARIEYRNFYYPGDDLTEHSWRLRDRLEFNYPLNNARMSDPKTYYVLADAEAYFPLDQGIAQTFASKVRVRAGLGYRASNTWRVDVLFIRDWSRNTIEAYDIAMNAIDIRFRWVF